MHYLTEGNCVGASRKVLRTPHRQTTPTLRHFHTVPDMPGA